MLIKYCIIILFTITESKDENVKIDLHNGKKKIAGPSVSKTLKPLREFTFVFF